MVVVPIQVTLIFFSFLVIVVYYYRQGVIFPAGAWVIPAGNRENHTGNVINNLRAYVPFLFISKTKTEIEDIVRRKT